MSMSKKIYSIVLLLIAVAVVIAGIAFYNIRNLNEQASSAALLGNRSLAITAMRMNVLLRQNTMNLVIASLDEKTMADLMNNEMKAIEVDFMAELANYRANIVPPGHENHESQTTQMNQVEAAWKGFVDVTRRACELSLGNSSVLADREALKLVPFWGGFLEKINELAATIFADIQAGKGDMAAMIRNADMAKGVMTKVVQYRLDSLKYNLNSNTAAIKTLEDILLKSKDAFLNDLVTLQAELPAGKSRDLATELVTLTRDNIEPFLARLLPIVNLDSKNRARELFAAEGQPYMDELMAVASNVVERTILATRSNVVNAQATATQIYWVMGVVSVVGVVVGLILSILVIRGITSRLHGIINRLGAASSLVNSASEQINQSAGSLSEGSTEQAASPPLSNRWPP